MTLVDSDLLIDVLRNEPRAVAWFSAMTPPPDVPGYVAMELKQGCRDGQALAQVERLLRPLTVIWPSSQACDNANALFGPAKLSHGIGLIDSLVAATALENKATLFTFNVRHFAGIPGVDARLPYQK